MAQWLRASTALPQDPSSIPSTHMAAHNCSSSSREPHTHGKTPMHIKEKENLLRVFKVMGKSPWAKDVLHTQSRAS